MRGKGNKSKSKPLEWEVLENGCWVCTSHKPFNSFGYFRIVKDRKNVLLHRHIWEECFGEIPEGMVVRHKCDNPSCINPEHLELGTQQDNIKDMIDRGRDNKAVDIPSGTVQEIRNSQGTTREIGERFGIHSSTVSRIKNGLRRAAH